MNDATLDHALRLEVTVAACITTPQNHPLGDNVADCTIGFYASMPSPPRPLTDVEVNRTITHHMSPVLAAIQTVLTSMGYGVLGTIDDPIAQRSTPTGEFGRSSPVEVHVQLAGPEGAA